MRLLDPPDYAFGLFNREESDLMVTYVGICEAHNMTRGRRSTR